MSFGIPVRNGLSIGLLASTFLTSGSGRLVPRLTLNFLTGAPLDSRITFSRTTNATLVDSTGLVTYAPNNLVLRSEEFDTASWTKDNATITANAAVAPDGTTTADKAIPSNGVDLTSIANGTVRQAVTYSAGATLTFSVFAKEAEFDRIELYFSEATGTANRATVTYSLVDGSVVTAAAVAGTFTSVSSTSTSFGNGWYRFTLTFTAGSSTTARARFAVRDSGTTTGDGTSGILIWGAQLEQVTYQTTPGTYNQTVASAYYGPRFDYNPVTLAPRGLLIEEQRVNLFTNSEVFENAAWVKGNSTVTANATVAPDGTTTADKLVENTATGAHQITQQTAFVSGTSYTWSFYVKAAERSVVRVLFPAAAFTSNLTANFDLATGAWRTGSPTPSPALTLASQDAGNGWYRIAATATATASLNQTILLLMVDTPSGTGNYTGNGTSGLFIWGAQLEAAAFATSYIPTVASTVTRAADVAVMTGTNFSSWYNQSEGTFVAQALPIVSAVAKYSFSVSDGTSNELLAQYFLNSNAGLFVNDGGIGQAQIEVGTFSGVSQVAVAYQLNNFAISLNGGSLNTDTSGTVPTVTQAQIGNRASGDRNMNGHVRTLTYYATRLTNAQLQALTS